MDAALLSLSNSCTYLDCSLSTLKRLISKGAFPAIKIGRTVRVRRSDVDAWIASLPPKGGQAND